MQCSRMLRYRQFTAQTPNKRQIFSYNSSYFGENMTVACPRMGGREVDGATGVIGEVSMDVLTFFFLLRTFGACYYSVGKREMTGNVRREKWELTCNQRYLAWRDPGEVVVHGRRLNPGPPERPECFDFLRWHWAAVGIHCHRRWPLPPPSAKDQTPDVSESPSSLQDRAFYVLPNTGVLCGVFL